MTKRENDEPLAEPVIPPKPFVPLVGGSYVDGVLVEQTQPAGPEGPKG